MTTTTVNGATSGDATKQELDIEKLHALPSEQQDLYLLTFTSDLARHVAALDKDASTAQQANIKKEVLKIIKLSSPAPTRVIRNNVGSCLAEIFSKGDRKLLFETVNELIALLNVPGKGDKELRVKHAATHCLGAVFEAAGDSAISASATACASMLRLMKPAQNQTGFRATLYRSLGRTIRGIGKLADEGTAQDVWKSCRNAATGDRSLLVQANACWCLEQLAQATSYFDNSSDFDRLQSTLWKTMDSSSPLVRRAAASCLSSVYVKNYVATPVPEKARFKKAKKTKQRLPDDDDTGEAVERAGSPNPSVAPTGLSFGLADILKQLSSQYCRTSTSNRIRTGIIHSYMRLVKGLGETVVGESYGIIALHLFNDLLGSPSVTNNRYRLLITRKFVQDILSKVIGCRLLGESGQIKAVKFLVNDVLKDYPQSDIKERIEPSKYTLTGALDALGSLMQYLGSAVNGVAELCRSGLLQVLEHPSYTVQVHTAKCLQIFVQVCPQQLLPSATICLNSVTREVGFLTGARKSPRRCLGLALGLASVISTSSKQPLYGSVEVYSRVLSQATAFLKSSSGSDLRVSATQIQVSWVLIGSLMSLGPSFVKIHLSQLLLLWKNALPKPLGKNNAGQEGLLELSFLTHVRECALGSMKAFFTFNSRLLTLDVSNRLASLLQNTAEFLGTLPKRKSTEDKDKLLYPSLQLHDYDLMVRRRLFECYADLLAQSPRASYETFIQSNVVSLAVSAFADPETMSTHSISSSIATSSGNFETIWEVGDNSGYGITGLVKSLDLMSVVGGTEESLQRHWMSGSSIDALVDATIQSPMSTAIEHDPLKLYTSPDAQSAQPLATAVIDAAIRLFAMCLPFQAPRVQQGVLEQMSSQSSSSNPQQLPARDVAVSINVAAALLYALQVACSETSMGSGDMKNQRIQRAVQDLLHGFLAHPDHSTRHLASEGLGRLCKTGGNDFLTQEVTYLVDRIIKEPDPFARSGCALALGCVSSQVGGMAAGIHMKKIVGILTSLAMDPHPTVHFWALDSLSKVADSTGLSFSSYVPGTLGMLAQLYVAESHGEENVSLASSNLELECSSLAAVTRCVTSMINVLGPDIQDMTKARNMILTLTYQFQTESSQTVATESLRCLEGLSMYASGQISTKPYLRQLQSKMASEDPDVSNTALTGLYNAMRKDAEDVIASADAGLEDQLWLALNDSFGTGIVLEMIKDWVHQTGMSNIDTWVRRIQTVLTRAKKHKLRKENVTQDADGAHEPDTIDEEVAGFAASAAQTSKDDPDIEPEASQELLRWQVRCVAMNALNSILGDVVKDVAAHGRSDAAELLQDRIGEVIRIAFSASTAAVIELRIVGIQLIGRLLEIFGRVPDPDFPEVTLLEQYQAQISSALTPAFAADSSPALAAEAVNVCALFISTGIVTDKERMGRILRLLISALEDFSKTSETLSIGELQGLSSNAQVMVRLAVFSAWAELQNATHEQRYLNDIVSPHLARLTPLWLSSLQEYARLKFEPDISTAGAGAPVTGKLDDIYAALNRETLLAFYQASWLNFVEAIASLIDLNSDFVFNALEGKVIDEEQDEKRIKTNDINYRDEPVAFFFVLFGISFEALLAKPNEESIINHQRTLEILQALEKILRPSVAGSAIYQDAIFTETMDIFDRLALTEGLEVQTVIVDIARNMCVAHPSARRSHETNNDEALSDDIEQLFELTRIIVLVISNHIPKLSEDQTPTRSTLSEDAVQLILQSLTALVSAAAVFPAIIKSDLHACIFHIFAALLASPPCQTSLVPQALPILRGFVTSIVVSISDPKQHQHHRNESISQLRTALHRFSLAVQHAQRREHEAAAVAERNALLAGTILLTAGARVLPPDDAVVLDFVSELTSGCLESASTTKVAAGLCRSLILLPTSARSSERSVSSTEAQIAAHIVPHLISFMIAPQSDVDGLNEARSIVSQALTSFANATGEQSKGAAYAVVVPALLRRAELVGKGVWLETSARLLDLAGRDPDRFRGVLHGMDGQQKSFAEEVIRKGGGAGGAKKVDDGEAKEPSIALKLDF
ncbi:hypothetical protein FH972_023616 [Carpinus fangiana]|uniref:LAA1-like C-terminal TPR repeats domain-containing protein n=1 Tax=Carpinus fangiana TaxID=176857 RepID=A0A5N6KW27_9ROSI|nr:hypothetical protein FH972_023616 [Carpinus fangiana]